MGIAGVAYDPGAGIMEVAFTFTSTIVPMVLGGFEFWLLLFMNLVVCVTKHLNLFDPTEYHIDLPWGLTGVTGSLMTFFVCFYNQHVFGRYNKLYALSKKMTECCLEIVSILRVQLMRNKAAQRRIAKLVIASCFMFFFERTESGDETSALSKREFKQLKGLGLLGDLEIDHLRRHCDQYQEDALPSFIVLQWAMMLMRKETPNPEERDDMLAGFNDRIFHVRTCQAEVCQILDLPMPFQYFHIMNLMLILNLVLWSYSLGCQDSYWAPVIYMFVQMMFQGIRELSTALSDPFGDDEVDFPITQWMIAVYARLYGVLEDPFDITKIDLNRDKPFIDPQLAKQNKMIDVYVDLDVGGESDLWCGIFPCGSPSKDENTRLTQGEEYVPRPENDIENPLLGSEEEDEESE
jgi:predicted membrane chloride channel (bestrophin family)